MRRPQTQNISGYRILFWHEKILGNIHRRNIVMEEQKGGTYRHETEISDAAFWCWDRVDVDVHV